jgi:cytochrome c-type biogenesis protein CcmH
MLRTVKRFGIVWVVLAMGLAPVAAAEPAHIDYEVPDAEFDEPIEGAKRLEGRLLAPCCWDSSRQTLDIHGSPVANQLRREIRSRLRAGQSPDVIEADLVARYGEKILAVPTGNPLREVGIGLSVLVVLGAVGVGTILGRWRRRSDGDVKRVGDPNAKRDEWDDRLDEELRDVD